MKSKPFYPLKKLVVPLLVLLFLSIAATLVGTADRGSVYILGEKIHIEIESGSHKVTIISPDETTIQKVNGSFIFKPKYLGEHKIQISGKTKKTLEFLVKEEQEEKPLDASIKKDRLGKAVEKLASSKVKEEDLIRIGKPVVQTKNLTFENATSGVVVEIPSLARDVRVASAGEERDFSEKNSLISRITGLFASSDTKEIVVEGSVSGSLQVTYETPGPTKEEAVISGTHKQVTIDSPVHYEHVLSKTSISESVPVDKKDLITVHWREEGVDLDFEALDTNGNGLVDAVQWVTPHLSTQNFDVKINVLNLQSYPIVGGSWKVRFVTLGKDDLVIRAIDGTSWDEDLEFREVSCGPNKFAAIRDGDAYIVKDFECSIEATEVSQVVTEGKHHLEFSFGDQVAYANNYASLYKIVGEWGNVSDLQVGSWTHVLFQASYDNPPVVIHQVDYDYDYDDNPCLTRIRGVNTSGFQIRAESWSSSSCPATGVNAYWVAAEKGTHNLTNNGSIVRTIEVQNFTLSTAACGSGANPTDWTHTANHRLFNNTWTSMPLVLGSVQSANDLDVISHYLRGCDNTNGNSWNTTCVEVGMSGMENDGATQPCNLHTSDEEGGFIAWEMNNNWSNAETRDNTGTISDGTNYYTWEAFWEADTVAGSQNDPFPISDDFVTLLASYSEGTAFGSGKEIDGSDGWMSAVDYDWGSSVVYVLAVEDEYGDTESTHTNEPWQVLFFNTSSGFLFSNVTNPAIQIVSPLNESVYAVDSVDLNITTLFNQSTCQYSLDAAANVTLTKENNTFFYQTVSSLSQGNHTVVFYCNDSSNEWIGSDTHLFTVDSTNLSVTLQSPLAQTYNTGTLQINASLNKTGVWCGYSLNGAANVSMSSVNSTFFTATTDSIDEDEYTVVVTCQDNRGVYANDSRLFVVETFTYSSIGEWGNVSDLQEGSWTHVLFQASYDNPPVVIHQVDYDYDYDDNPCLTRIRGVNTSGFQIRAESWSPSGNCPATDVNAFWLAVEQGVHNVSNNGTAVRTIEAQNFSMSSSACGSGAGTPNTWDYTANHRQLTNTWVNQPLVLGSVQSANDLDVISYYIKGCASGNTNTWNTTCVQIGLNGMENDGATQPCNLHTSDEEGGLVAWEMETNWSDAESRDNNGTISDGVNYYAWEAFWESDNVEGSGNDLFPIGSYSVTLSEAYTSGAAFGSGIRIDGGNGILSVLNFDWASSFIYFLAEEDEYGDTETAHTAEPWQALFFNGSGGELYTSEFVPTVSILHPVNGSTYGQSVIDFNASTQIPMDWCGYSLNGAANVTLGQVNRSFYSSPSASLSDADHNLTVYCNDTFSNLYVSNTTLFTIDSTVLNITIVSPLNQTYNSSAVDFNVSLTKAAQWCGYSLNGAANVTMTEVNSTYFWADQTYLREASHSVTFFCEDLVGTTYQNSTVFSVDVDAPLNVTRGSTVISNTNTDVNVSVNFSDLSKAFVLFSAQSGSSGPSQIRAEAILHDGFIQFIRYSSTGDLNIDWELIESPDVYVQRNSSAHSTSDSIINDAVTAVNTSQSFLIASSRLDTGTSSANVQSLWTARLSSSTNVVLERATTGSSGSVHYQLVEWSDAFVQSGTETITGTSVTRALSTAVNTTRSFIAHTRRVTGATSLTDTSVGSYFSDSSTINFYREGSGGTATVDWFVVEDEEFEVQSGFTSVSGSSQVDQSISTVNQSRAFSHVGYSSTGGGTTFANNLFTHEISSTTNLAFQKGTGSQTQNASWFVIEAGNTPTPDFITVIQPTDGSYYNTSSLYFNVSTTQNASACWYSLDGAANASLIELNNTYFYNLTTGLSEGVHGVVFYCNDSLSTEYGSSNITFYIDQTAPSPILVIPSNASVNDTNTIWFGYNVSDNFGVSSCSLYANGVLRWVDPSPSVSQTNTFQAYVPNGVHEWNIECTDLAGNTNVSSNRTLTVNGSDSYNWGATWYETSTVSFTNETANINLNNTRDGTDNQVEYSLPSSSLTMITLAKSPFLANRGALIPGSTTLTFSGFMSATSSNVLYITWKAYAENMSGNTLICQAGDDLTGGTRISSASGTWTDTCTSPASDFVLSESDRLRLEINVYNSAGSYVDVTHIWDNLRLSYLGFGAFNVIGKLIASLSAPLTSQSLNVGEELNVTCTANCSVGTCYGTDMYLEYNTSDSGWQNVSSSGKLVLGSGESNPHDLGDITAGSTDTNFTIRANQGGKYNYLRCRAVGTYDSNYTDDELLVNVSSYPQIYFTGGTPANATNLLSSFFNISVAINDTSLEEYIFNFNGENYTFLKDKLDLFYSGITTQDLVNSSNLVYGQPMSLFPNDTNLSLAWTFNNESNFHEGSGTITDFAGYDDNGTITGATINTSGRYNNSIRVTGTDYVRASAFSGLSSQNQATISAWVKQDSNAQNDYLLWADGNILIQFGDSFNIPGAQNLRVRWNLDGAWRNSHTAVGVLDNNTWHHWTFTFDNGNTSIYRDGVNVYNGTDTQTAISSSSPDYDLGYRSGQGGLDGNIDEFIIWNRALSSDEIYAIGASDLVKNSSVPWTHFVNVTTLPDGNYTYYGYARNKDGNENRTETRFVSINTSATAPPVITILSPLEGAYYNVSAVDFNVSLDRAGDWCGYSLDGAANVTMAQVNSTYYSSTPSVSDGLHGLVFYCNSTFGIMGGSSNVSFTVDATAPALAFVSPTPAHQATRTVNHTPINITINEGNLLDLTLEFNESNTSFYDPNLVLMMNLNNNSALGENSSYVYDSSLYENHGDLRGNADWNSSGRYRGAVGFDGTDDWIDVADSSSIEGMGEFTLEAWVYDTGNDALPRAIASKRVDSSTTSFAIFLYTSRYIYFDIGSSADRHDSGTALSANQWNHIAVTFNGSEASGQRKRFYLNGELVATTASSQTTIPDTSANLTIGILNDAYGNSWEGLIDEVRIYNRTLSTETIQRHFQSNLEHTSSSAWTLYSNITNLSDGSYNYSAYSTDRGGYQSTLGPRNIKIAASVIPPLINLNLPSNATVSTISTVDFNFTAIDVYDASVTCNLSVGDTQDNGFSASNNTLTNRQLSNLPDGVWSWNVSCINSANATNISESRQIEISESPKVFLNTSNESWFDDEVQITYTPFDNSDIASCSIYLDGSFNASNSSAITNGAGNDFFIFGVADGLHSYYVNCTDTYGLVNVSETRYFYHDGQDPSVVLSSPAPAEEVYDANITFNWTATDNLATNFFCNLTLDGSVIDANVAVVNDTLVSREHTVTAGMHQWNVTCIDNATNTFTSETRNFTNYLPPEVTLDQPSNATWLNYSNVTFIYNVFDEDANIANCSIYLDGAFNQSNATVVTNGELNNFTINNIAQGTHNWTVECVDYTNLTGTDTPREVNIDTEAPVINLSNPLDTEILAWNNLTFNWTTTDNLASTTTCNLIVDNFNEVPGISAPNNTVVTQYLLKGDGDYEWFVNCTDLANNTQTSATRNFTVDAPPIINLDDPANNHYTNLETIFFNYTPMDAIGIVSCNLLIDDVINQTDTTITPNVQNSFNVTGIPEGQHNWTVNCTDSDFNTGQASTRIFYRDLTPPIITLNAPQNNTGQDANDANVLFNWTATDALSVLLTCNLTVNGVIEESNVFVTSGVPRTELVGSLPVGQND